MGLSEKKLSDVRASGLATLSVKGGSVRSQRCHHSDLRLRDEVYACLCADPDLDIGDIRMTVARGAVLLEGTTSSHLTRTRIVDLVSNCTAVLLIRSSIRLADL